MLKIKGYPHIPGYERNTVKCRSSGIKFISNAHLDECVLRCFKKFKKDYEEIQALGRPYILARFAPCIDKITEKYIIDKYREGNRRREEYINRPVYEEYNACKQNNPKNTESKIVANKLLALVEFHFGEEAKKMFWDKFQGYTMREIGEKYNMSGEMARRKCKKIESKLKQLMKVNK